MYLFPYFKWPSSIDSQKNNCQCKKAILCLKWTDDFDKRKIVEFLRFFNWLAFESKSEKDQQIRFKHQKISQKQLNIVSKKLHLIFKAQF